MNSGWAWVRQAHPLCLPGSPAKSLNTRTGMLSGPAASRPLILQNDLLTLSSKPGHKEGEGTFCAGVVFCASKPAKKVFSSLSRQMVLSQVRGGGL